MSAGDQLTEGIKDRIEVAFVDEHLKSKAIWVEIYRRVRDPLDEIYFPCPQEGWPTLSAIRGHITKKINPKLKIAKLAKKSSRFDIDIPWSLGESAKDKYHISPEATDELLRVWRYCLTTNNEFTMRQAQWVVRLCNVSGIRIKVDLLYTFARAFALREKIHGILRPETVFDTRDLEARLIIEDMQAQAHDLVTSQEQSKDKAEKDKLDKQARSILSDIKRIAKECNVKRYGISDDTGDIVTRDANANPKALIAEIRKQGRNSATEGILKATFQDLTEAEMRQIFGQETKL